MSTVRSYTKLYQTTVPQSQPLSPDQVLNNAGGFVYALDKWARLQRFLILGSDTPTYYQKAQALTKENGKVVNECWAEDPQKTSKIIKAISVDGRAPKNDPAIFALSLGSVHPNMEARQLAHAAVNDVCRTGTHLFTWMGYEHGLGKGSGRGFKRVLVDWYKTKDTDKLAYQAIKYRQRNGYTHKRAIELSNHGAGRGADYKRVALFKWMRGKELGEDGVGLLPGVVSAHLQAMKLPLKEKGAIETLLQLITLYKLPWEAIPTEALVYPKVWESLVPTLGLTAVIRNLGNMTSCGALTLQNYKFVTDKFSSTQITKSRVHPFAILQAMAVYRSGKGFKGSKTWTPVPKVLDALDEAFYKAFKNVEPTNKRILLALDVSGSMTSPLMDSPLSVREASSAMALVTLAVEPNCNIVGFTAGTKAGTKGSRTWAGSWGWGNAITPLNISARQRLDDVVRYTAALPFSGTDCSLPFLWAQEEGHEYDAVVIYTDNETWAGRKHPSQALNEYRKHIGNPKVKSIVCGMTSTGFSIADPNDAYSLDVVGMDSNVPSLINDFIRE